MLAAASAACEQAGSVHGLPCVAPACLQVLTVMVEGSNKITHARTHGCLHLIDLAGGWPGGLGGLCKVVCWWEGLFGGQSGGP